MRTETENTQQLVDANLHLPTEILPLLPRTFRQDWPVREHDYFRRIVLDTIRGGVWHTHLGRPDYNHLSLHQAQLAVDLCHEIVEGNAELRQLNNQSLIWRGK